MRKAISLVSFGVVFAALVLLMQYESPQFVEAQTPPDIEIDFPFLLERTQNSSSVLVDVLPNYDMVINKTFGLPNYILNDTGVYVPYLLTDNATAYKIESNKGSMIFHKSGCNAMFYNAGYVNSTTDQALVTSESWIIHQKDLTTNATWQYINEVNDASCVNTIIENTTTNSIVLESNKTSTGFATSSIKYILNNDNAGWKVLTQVTNDNSSWTNNTMGFIQTIDVPDTVTLNGTNYYIPDNNGTFFDHNFFNTTVSDIMLGPITHYSTDNGLVNLWGATLHYIGNQSKITFDYSFNDVPTMPGETYEIDPTFGFTSGTRARITVDNTLSDPCPNVGASISSPPSSDLMPRRTDGAGGCSRSDVEWDTSSIPSSADVTDVDLKLFISGTGSKNCDIWSIENQPSTRTAAQRFTDSKDGNEYVDDFDCTFAATTLDFDLGSTAESDLESHMSWFGVGIPFDDESFPAFDHQVSITFAQLQVQYTETEFTVQLNNGFRAHTISTTSCSTIDSVKATDSIEVLSSTSSQACIRSAVEWNISGIPDDATILDVDIEYDVVQDVSTRSCDYNSQIAAQPSVVSNPAFYNNIGSGTTYVNANTDCQLAVANDYQADLGATAVTHLQNQLALDWFGVGVKMDNEALTGVHFTDFGTDFDLIVMYQFIVEPPAPQKPLNVSATNDRDGKIRLTWDANNATLVTNYDVFSSDNYIGPYTLLDTIGNLTTFAHLGLEDNFEQYYKISAWFNPNGTNSTIVFGTSGNPFVNDTSNIAEQFLWMRAEGNFIEQGPTQSGTGATCPPPTSVTDVVNSFTVDYSDSVDASGCKIGKAFTIDRETTTQKLLPQFIDDHLISVDWLNDIQVDADTNLSSRCRIVAMQDALGLNFDSRLNITAAYETLFAKDETLSGGYTRCLTANAQRPELSASTPTDYLDSMSTNSSFYSFGKVVESNGRDVAGTDRFVISETNVRWGFSNPTTSKIWNIQEHPKFDDNSLIAAQAKENSGGKFNLNTLSDNTDRGQIVMFKEFNVTQVGGTGFNTTTITQSEVQDANNDAENFGGFDIAIEDVFFHPNGTKIYFPGNDGNDINEHDLTTAWDLSTRSFVQVFSVGTETTSPQSLHFKPDGLKFYVTGSTTIFEYDLTNAWDVSSASLLQSFSVAPQGDTPSDIFFTEDGESFWITTGLSQNVTEYDVGTAWDISTSTFVQALDVSADVDVTQAIWFNPSGDIMFVQDNDDVGTVNNLHSYVLSTPYDISTAVWAQEINMSEVIFNTFTGLFFRNDGLTLFLSSTDGGRMMEIDLDIVDNISDPNIRVTGEYQTNSVTDDVNLRFEIKDGSYAMGSDISFPQNEYDIYQGGGSLGVVHLSPSGTGVESFDISMTPNWSNSTGDIFTVFIGLDDNSTSSNLSANITSFHIQNTLKQDFEDLHFVEYYQSTCSTECDDGKSTGGLEDGLEARNFYNEGIVQAEQVVNPDVNFVSLPIPPAPTSANAVNVSGTEIDVDWNHSLLNVTDFQISRESPVGGGFTKILESDNIDLVFSDTGLMGGTEYNYEICGINGESIDTVCITASATTNASPAPAPPDIDNVFAVANLEDIIVTWFDSGINITDYQIERNGTLIVPSVTNTTSDFLVDDFSSYPDVATANATWVGTIGVTDPLDDIATVNVTDDRIYYRSSPGGESQINLDLESLLGQNLTDASGIGDFNMTWTQQELNHDGALNEVGGMYLKFSDRIATGAAVQTGIRIDFNYREAGFNQQAAIRTAEDNLGFNSFISIDSNCGDGGLGFIDVAPNDSIADTPVTLYGQFTKVGQQLTYMMGTNPDWTGLGCSAAAPSVHILDNMKYLALTRSGAGSGSTDSLITFDDFTITVNGTLVKFYRDENVTLGTHFDYNVSAINSPPGFLPTIGNAKESNVVKSNDIPSATLNVTAATGIGKIVVDWDAPTSDGSGNPLGVGVPILNYEIFSKNVTDGDDFILTQELLSPTTFDDFAVELPKDYNYTISACNFLGCGPNSTEVAAFLAPLDAPVNLTATIDRLIEIFLDWDSVNATTVTGYNIYNSSTGAAPFELLNTIGNTTNYTDTGLPNEFDMFYKVSALSPVNTGLNSTVVMGATISPGEPDVITSVTAVANIGDVIVDWVGSGINTTDFQVERNGTLIAPSTIINSTYEFVSADEDVFIDDLLNLNGSKWQFREQRLHASAGVIATCGFAEVGGRLQISAAQGESECTLFKTFPRVFLNNSNFQIQFEYTHIATPSGLFNEVRINTQDSPNAYNRDDKGPPLWTLATAAPFAVTEIDSVASITITNGQGFFNTGIHRETRSVMFDDSWIDTDYSSVRIRLVDDNGVTQNAKLFVDWINITDRDTGDDRAFWNFTGLTKQNEAETCANVVGDGGGPRCIRGTITAGDFSIAVGSVINQTLGFTYNDTGVALGEHFTYDVTGINAPPGSTPNLGTPTTSNVVLSNDVPTQIQNILAILNNFFTLGQIELSWNQAGNGTGNPLGVGVDLTSTKIFSRNVTGGNDFILTEELFGSPPVIELNDTNVVVPNDYSYMLSSCNILGCGPNSTEVFADTIDLPDAIFDLLFYDLDFKGLVLNWTQPFLGGGTLQDGYQINFTTPFEDPLTIIEDDTESSFTEFTISGLTELTNYSFRVSAINQAGLNATGLILNITTPEDFTQENFTVGFIGEFPDSDIDETNPDIIPIRFERIDLNDTTVRLNVTYANNIDLACQFEYKFAMTESFFDAPLDTVSVGGGDQETSFLFTDFDNEVVDVFCWNEVNNQSAGYILTQTNFPLLQQISAFRAGDFGTDGMFGVLDMITLMVIIISMIGFNRVNETVGAIFNIIFIGSLAFFDIIELSTTIFSAVALVLMLVIISTRKV